MKIVYHINSLYNPGGMERVVLNKATWLVEHGYEVVVVTTDQKGRKTFYPFPSEIRIVDLGINYSDDKGKNIVAHTVSYLRKRKLHKARLSSLLLSERADIVDTLYPGESSFIPSISDGSRKVIELHQSRFFHRQYANSGLKGLIDRIREKMDVRMVSRFDKFVVLTEEDLGYWGGLKNICAIPNAARRFEEPATLAREKRVIAVGRLDYQKSYDRLIEAWSLIPENGWTLEIFGQGEDEGKLHSMIASYGLEDRVHINKPTGAIAEEYRRSSIHVMSSHYEGFPMVMVEAMGLGLPEVCFDFKCGPRDIVSDGVNGLIVPDGDIEGMAGALRRLMENDSLREKMGLEATRVLERYSEEKVMEKWEKLYSEITSKKVLHINPVVRRNTSTGKIMQEIGAVAVEAGWKNYIAYSRGRDGIADITPSIAVPVGSKLSVGLHGLLTRLFDAHGEGSIIATLRFIREIKEIDPDIIHIHNVHGYFLNYPLLFKYLASSGKQVVWTVHDCWLYTGHCYHYTVAGCSKWKTHCENCPQRKEFPKSMFFDRSYSSFELKKKAFTSLPRDKFTLVTVSEWMGREMSESFLKDCRFKLIHNGIDINTFKPSPNDSAVRAEYGLGERKIILALASIWSREKGFFDLVEMAKKLNPDEVLVMVGVSDAQSAELPEGVVAIRRTANATGLAALYSAASAFVNPTYQDNYPTVNMEAIACGTPVVTYRTGGSIETITPMTGRIVPVGDIETMLEAVREIEGLGKEYFAESCRSFAEANFSKEERYKDYIELYESLTAR
ncbi:MAG: glycosyltransferase [Bacteroidales bacterium]|nr:glycosyltransferase [Bacteroidales bacterium]